jgi:hypothetical protein
MEKNFSNQLTTERLLERCNKKIGAMLVQPEEDDELRFNCWVQRGRILMTTVYKGFYTKARGIENGPHYWMPKRGIF